MNYKEMLDKLFEEEGKNSVSAIGNLMETFNGLPIAHALGSISTIVDLLLESIPKKDRKKVSKSLLESIIGIIAEVNKD
jgi:hypothetical protein